MSGLKGIDNVAGSKEWAKRSGLNGEGSIEVAQRAIHYVVGSKEWSQRSRLKGAGSKERAQRSGRFHTIRMVSSRFGPHRFLRSTIVFIIFFVQGNRQVKFY